MKSDTKKEVIEVARHLFGTQGFKNTTMSDIAQAVGVQKPSLYYFFSSKEDICVTVLNMVLKEVIEIFRSFSGEVGPEELQVMIKAVLKKGIKEGGSGMMVYREMAINADSDLMAETKKLYQTMVRELADVLHRAGVRTPFFAAQVLIDSQQMYLIRRECREKQDSVERYAFKMAQLLIKEDNEHEE